MVGLAPSCFFNACCSSTAVTLSMSGPAVIQRLSTPGLPVCLIAPPQPFTIALVCSWHWSSAMAENLLPVLCTTKFPDLNSTATSGFFFRKRHRTKRQANKALPSSSRVHLTFAYIVGWLMLHVRLQNQPAHCRRLCGLWMAVDRSLCTVVPA